MLLKTSGPSPRIAELPFVANTALRTPLKWSFSRDEIEHQTVMVHPVALLDATLAVREAVLQGIGLAVLPDFAVESEIASGRLLHVLPQWRLPSGGIHAVFPAARFRPAKVRAFVDLMVDVERDREALNAGGLH